MIWMKSEYADLIGGKILEAGQDEDRTPYLHVRLGTGEEVTLFVLRDPEGNGPGFLEIVKGGST